MSLLSPISTSIGLDQQILFWVVLPITFVMLLSGIISTYFHQSTQSTPVSSILLIKHQSVLSLCDKFSKHYLLLTPHAFTTYQNHLFSSIEFGVHENAGKKRQELYDGGGDNNDNNNDNNNNDDNDTIIESNEDVIDPNNLINGMFSSVLGIIPNTLQFVWISYFFTGFIIGRFPINWFPTNFKPMFHHSIPPVISRILPTNYISSISWYVLNLLGLSSFKSLLLELLSSHLHSNLQQQISNGDDSTDIVYQQTIGTSLPKQDQFQQLNPLTGGGPDFNKDYKLWSNELKLLQYNSNTLIYSQNELLLTYRKKKMEQQQQQQQQQDQQHQPLKPKMD